MAARRFLHVDASAGASGDMILGALVDLGVPLARIRAALETLPIRGFKIATRRVTRAGLTVRRVEVRVAGPQPARGWRDLSGILRRGRLPGEVRDRALAVFRRLVEAEAEVHGVPVDRVHLHEAGAVDAIVDVVGACVGVAHLAPDRILVSPMTTGYGTVACEHGVYPVPAPATALLVRGAPVRAGDLEGERLTPTGAAILTTVADAWGAMPAMRPERVGYGAGSREFPGVPNALRMILGSSEGGEDAADAGDVIAVEVTLDDAPPQTVAYAAERLFAAGALEVYTTAVQMKKGRSGQHLTVLARPASLETIAQVVFAETTTLGLRYRRESRIELERRTDSVRTALGAVRVKVGLLAGQPIQAWPEYEDCAAIARRRRVPLKEVQRAALEAHGKTRGRRKAR
jgi:hypothetical protein